ncbi:MAG: tRNA epoxyqueuosine(34) reductase QueG [Bacteroides sp.]|nr:tRNA epoxyqueuosine(34) reductase QueG [Bacteroides sp.]
MAESDKEEVRSMLLHSGAVAVGFAVAENVNERVMSHYMDWVEGGKHADMDYLRRHIPLKRNPDSVLPGVATVISMAFSYAPRAFRSPELPQIACYAYGYDYHDVIRKRLTTIVEQLKEKLGGDWRICIDSAPLAERYWALKSGIGIRGLNGSVIVAGSGGYVFLAEILSTIVFPPDNPSHGECKKCGACQEACPQNALYIDGCVDSRRCLNYLTIEHRGEWQGEYALYMKTKAACQTLYGCDICLRVCPHNVGITPTNIPEFEPRSAIMTLRTEEIAQLSQEQFSALFKGSPIKRAKLAGIMRNALNIISSSVSSEGRESL